MTAYTDNQLAGFAPNITVRVATPQPYDSSTVVLSASSPQNVVTLLDIASKGTANIIADRTQDIINNKIKNNILSKFLIKMYSLTPPYPPFQVPPTPPQPPPPPPPSKLIPGIFPTLPDNLPFGEPTYLVKDLIGLTPPVTPPGQPKIPWTPLSKSTLKTFDKFPSAVYIPAISSCISAPYWAPEAKRHRNGVSNLFNEDRAHTTYLWEQKRFNFNGKITQSVSPRNDGVVDVTPQPRDIETAWPTIYLDPGKWERGAAIKNGKSLNAFSLVLGIAPGPGDMRSQAAIWTIVLTFGDVTVTLVEGRAEAQIFIKGMESPHRLPIKPTSASYLTSGFGERPYVLTFIPVWGGLLVSDGVPGSSEWSDTVSFIPIKDVNLDVNAAIQDALNPQPTLFQQKNNINPFPPKVIVTRNKTTYMTPGVKIKTRGARVGNAYSTKVMNVGTRLSVDFTHCGGAMKFVPIYFPQYSRYIFPYSGAADPEDVKGVQPKPRNPQKPKAPNRPPNPVISVSEQNIFKVKSHTKAQLLPVFTFETVEGIDFRTNLATIVTNKSNLYSCLALEFKSVNADLRIPIQIWGVVTLDKVSLNDGLTITPPLNAEGFLTINDVPEFRIRSVSVSRNLDGSNGEIIWDLYDPTSNQILNPPPQRIGALQMALQGGSNTIPGVIFTGIALGNSLEIVPNENLVKIPLRGREAKLEQEGGIVLVNAPFFDGYDHRDVMSFLANYGGVPIDTRLADPFRLISSYNINSPILDFPMGTGVKEAMDTICRQAQTIYYFDRFGTLIYIEAERSTGVNWNYPDATLEQLSIEPDYTWVRNQIIIYALLAAPGPGRTINVDFSNVPTQVVLVRVPVQTYPEFPWDKMAVYTIPQIVRDQQELLRLATRIGQGVARPRASARCSLPGNAQIELLDTLNNDYIITSITHSGDLQGKKWTTTLGVELFNVPNPVFATPTILPLSDLN